LSGVGEDGGPVQRAGVAFDDARAEGRHLGLEHSDQTAVDLHGGDVGAGLDEGSGERAQARADLDDVVTRSDPGQSGDAANGVRVDDEVLAEAAPGRQPVPGQQLRRLARGVRHLQVMRTGIGAWTRSESWAKTFASSTMTCVLSVPVRSTTVHVAVWPLSRFVTVTRLPTLRDQVAQGSVAHGGAGAQRWNDAVPVLVVSDGGAGTAMVIEPAVSAVVVPPTRYRAELSVVDDGWACGADVDADSVAGDDPAATTALDALLSSGDANASPPGATAATVGWFTRLSFPSRSRIGSAASVRQDATTRRTRSPCANLSSTPPRRGRRPRGGRPLPVPKTRWRVNGTQQWRSERSRRRSTRCHAPWPQRGRRPRRAGTQAGSVGPGGGPGRGT